MGSQSEYRPAVIATALLAVATPVFVGCEGDPPGVVRSDSAGIEIVTNHDPAWPEGGGWEIAAEPQIVIGESDADTANRFTTISSVLPLAGGGTVAANRRQPPALFLYSATGELQRVVGRSGGGPGEFGEVTGLWHAGPDTIVAYDMSGRRLTVLDDTLSLVEIVDVDIPQVDWGVSYLDGRFADGTYLLRPFVRYPADVPSEAGRHSQPILRFHPGSGVVDTVAPAVPDVEYLRMRNGLVTGPLFGRRAILLAHDSLVYHGFGDDFVFETYHTDGRLLRRTRRAFTPREITPGDFERHVTNVLANRSASAARFEPEEALRKILSERNTADAFPAFDVGSIADDRDNVWIPGYPLPGDSLTRWSVFDPAGRWLGVVTAPRQLRIHAVKGDRVFGVWRGDLGVESVRVYRLTRR